MDQALLAGLPVDLIRAAYEEAPGNEIASGKLFSPESSSALVANTFGLFLDRPGDLPALPNCDNLDWPATSVRLEAIVRFPWSGGRHPCLDVLVETPTALIGIESKRFEPFRSKAHPAMSEAYWRPVWGDAMAGYACVRDGLRDDVLAFCHLDAGQLVKHAFALRTAVHRAGTSFGKRAVLLYLYAEPSAWPDGRPIPDADVALHNAEIAWFTSIVGEDEVAFRHCTYRQLLDSLAACGEAIIAMHAEAVRARFNLP
ncbi:hypothetical protein [Azospirillum sp. B2RO_4]|uniref:hypothetical protein n=1 Tax=Azospirillum sp. B2RO_4 TaxID=3027796 RepID=UPI003DA9AD9E